MFLVSLAFSESPFLGRKYKIGADKSACARPHGRVNVAYVGSDLLKEKRERKRERSNDAIKATTDYILLDRYQKFMHSPSVILYLILTFQCIELISVHMPRKDKG